VICSVSCLAICSGDLLRSSLSHLSRRFLTACPASAGGLVHHSGNLLISLPGQDPKDLFFIPAGPWHTQEIVLCCKQNLPSYSTNGRWLLRCHHFTHPEMFYSM
jgi:hypothetical protein